MLRGWRELAAPPDVVPRLAAVAFERYRVFMPFVILAVVVALAISAPIGIATPLPVIVTNVVIVTIAIAMYFAIRHGKVPMRYAHAVGAFVWLLPPINTLSSYALTGQATLTLPLMIELSMAPLQVSTAWALASTVPVVVLGVPLSLRAGELAIYPVCVVGIWVSAMLLQIFWRRSIIRDETARLALARELDERQRAEAERERLRVQFMHAQRMEAVGTLAAGLAHDMNNILGGVLAFAEVLHAEAKDKDVRADLARIRQEAERGAALTRSLLAFSRRGVYRRQAILLHSVLDDMMPLLSRTLGKSVSVTRKDGPATIVEADPAQLGQIVLNLCMNGADAMNGIGTLAIATDEVSLEATNGARLKPGRYAKLSVTDTGCGMDAETRRRAFEPFFTTKPIGKGTGLGLAMVIGAVEAHGGGVVIDSAVGKGTTMTLYLPASEAKPRTPTQRIPVTPRRRGVVLVVDDEPIIRQGTIRLVEQLGLSALSAADGVEAIALYEQHRKDISLVMLDMVMPRLAGPDCFKKLRALGSTPVLIVSGYAEDAAARAMLEAGAEGFLEKPYTASQLGKEIERILG